MRWEAIAVNADFWSQVLQSNTLKPQNFALGAVMIIRREDLKKVGGFASLLDYLADDYQLGHRIAASGKRIVLSPMVVECWDKPMTFREVWNHQLRWARTIRVSQPLPYFFSVLSNVTLWAILLILLGEPGRLAWFVAAAAIVLRTMVAVALAIRLMQSRAVVGYWWLTPVKDLLQVGIWSASFLGNTVEWGGKKFRLQRGGKLVPF